MISRQHKEKLNKMNSMAANVQLGTLLRQRQGILKGVINVSADARKGVVSAAHSLLDEDGNAIVLPAGAIITRGWMHIVTTFTSTSNNGTIALNCNSAGDLLVAVDADTIDDSAALVTLIPDGTLAAFVLTTAERTLTYAVATNKLLTGKMHVFLEYMLSTETE